MQSTLSFDGRKKKGRERLLVKNEITERGEIVAFGTRSTIEKKKSRWFIYDLPVLRFFLLLLRFLTFTMMIWFPFFTVIYWRFVTHCPQLSHLAKFQVTSWQFRHCVELLLLSKRLFTNPFFSAQHNFLFQSTDRNFCVFPPSKYFLYRMSFDGKKNKFFFSSAPVLSMRTRYEGRDDYIPPVSCRE